MADDEFPPELRDLPRTFEGYGQDRWIVARERVTDSEVEPALERLLANATSRSAYEIYEELDLGPGGYAIAPSTDTRRGVQEAMRKKLDR